MRNKFEISENKLYHNAWYCSFHYCKFFLFSYQNILELLMSTAIIWVAGFVSASNLDTNRREKKIINIVLLLPCVESITGPCKVEHLFNLFQMSHMEAFTLISTLWSCCRAVKNAVDSTCLTVHTHTHTHTRVYSANACSKSGSFTVKPQLFFTHGLWFVCLLTNSTCASLGHLKCRNCAKEDKLNLTTLI